MSGNDREPIGRKGKSGRPEKTKAGRRRIRDEYDNDDYEHDDGGAMSRDRKSVV